MQHDEQSTGLMARPQRLGILPTMSFWQDPKVKRIVGAPFTLIVAILAVAGWFISANPLIETAVLMVVYFGGMGLLERCIRQRVLRRRELAASEPPALGEGE